jgi:hypothetical protein
MVRLVLARRTPTSGPAIPSRAAGITRTDAVRAFPTGGTGELLPELADRPAMYEALDPLVAGSGSPSPSGPAGPMSRSTTTKRTRP